MSTKNKATHKPIKKVGIVVKHRVAEANNMALDLAKVLKRLGVKTFFASESRELCERGLGVECASKEDLIDEADLILVLGGDGTFISVARLMYKRSVPLMGINMGTLGFLTDVKRSEAQDMLKPVLAGKYATAKRILLTSSLIRKGEEIARQIIVNDVVVHKAAIARIIESELNINGETLANIRGDGVIVSTPAGSTAYSLAAGGPVIEPSLPALIMTPICPHSLTLRPLVINDSSQVDIRLIRGGEAIVTWDGQSSERLMPDDIIKVSKYKKHSLQIVQLPQRTYYGLLREKLKYGYRD
jgi:NAD+ kinase